MDNDKLLKAKKLKEKIEYLDKWFDYFSYDRHVIKLARKRGKLFLVAYLFGNEEERIEIQNGTLKNRIMKAIGQELDSVKKEFENL